MKKILDLGMHRRARVWIGECPEASYAFLNTAKLSIPAGRSRTDGSILAAIEVLVPLGGRSMYGLLGGDFRADSVDRLDVEVRVASEPGDRFDDSLASTGDEVRLGLPHEYIQGVLDGLALAKGELGRLVAGRLLINYAAHGAIGSSRVIFKHLAAALVKLFNRDRQPPSDTELLSLFPSTFS